MIELSIVKVSNIFYALTLIGCAVSQHLGRESDIVLWAVTALQVCEFQWIDFCVFVCLILLIYV